MTRQPGKKDIAEQIRRETESFDRELEAETSARIDEVRTSMEAEMKKKAGLSAKPRRSYAGKA